MASLASIKVVYFIVALFLGSANFVEGTPPTYWPETLHYGRWELATKLKVGNPSYEVVLFCGPPSMSETVLSRARDVTASKNVKTWSQYVSETGNPYGLSLPTCPESAAMNALGMPVQCDAVLMKGYKSKVISWVRELAVTDNYYQEVTCARELTFRDHILGEIKQPMNNMGNGPGITKDGRSIVPRMLRHMFHDVLDYNNLILTGNPSDSEYLKDMTKEAALSLRMAANASAPLKLGGMDFCFVDPMESVLDPVQQQEVRSSDSGFMAGLTESSDPGQNNFLSVVETEFTEDLDKLKLSKNLAPNADLLTLTTAAGLEKFFEAPRLPVKYGRRSGDACTTTKSDYGLKASVTLSWNKTGGASHNLAILDHLGFSDPVHAAAIMGAHSIGHVQPCNSGDLAGGGFYCEADYLSYAVPPTVAQKQYGPGDILPGSVWDTTPMNLDNDYFNMLLDVNNAFTDIPEDVPSCGGPSSFQCQEEFCFKESPYEVIVRPNVTGVAVDYKKRVALLSSEVGMLGDSAYLSAVQAMTPSVFHEKFAEAFEILQSIGYYDEELNVCKPSPCSPTSDGIKCGENINSLPLSISAAAGGDLSECELTGAYADTLAYLSCGTMGEYVCHL